MTPTMPTCSPFGYMNAKAAELRPIVQRFVDDPDTVDPCGPSPVIISVDLLRRLTPEWLRLSFELKRDAEANRIFGWVLEMWGCTLPTSSPLLPLVPRVRWVLEMWGYTLAANKLGVRHYVWQSLQTEPSALWHTDLDGDPHIYHVRLPQSPALHGHP